MTWQPGVELVKCDDGEVKTPVASHVALCRDTSGWQGRMITVHFVAGGSLTRGWTPRLLEGR